jgi:hypothetical protein
MARAESPGLRAGCRAFPTRARTTTTTNTGSTPTDARDGASVCGRHAGVCGGVCGVRSPCRRLGDWSHRTATRTARASGPSLRRLSGLPLARAAATRTARASASGPSLQRHGLCQSESARDATWTRAGLAYPLPMGTETCINTAQRLNLDSETVACTNTTSMRQRGPGSVSSYKYCAATGTRLQVAGSATRKPWRHGVQILLVCGTLDSEASLFTT